MNTFQIYDNLVYQLYEVDSLDSLRECLLHQLQKLISFQYAGLVTFVQRKSDSNSLKVGKIFGEPASFAEVEQQSMERNKMEWKRRLTASSVTEVYHIGRNSEDISARMEYKNTYCSCDISDALRLVICSHEQTLGVLTLYRTIEKPCFSDSDRILLARLGRHLSAAMNALGCIRETHTGAEDTVEAIAGHVHMTPKEREILRLIFMARSNYEICDELNIKEHTLQKHFQNIYRKLNISSKWELMRYSVNAMPKAAVS